MLKEPVSREVNYPEGFIFNVDKPLTWTSSDVVRKIKYLLRKLGHRKIKVGHAGTLDPLATGVLLVCVGKATKMVEALQGERKEYVADIELGATTPSFDLEHPIDRRYPWEHITRGMVEEALKGLCGERLQTPPVYSSKKIDGRHAYDYAREGEEVQMRQALITVYEAELLECDLPHVRVRIECSKGTYIRSFAQELGEALASGAHLTALRRTRSGGFTADNAYSVEEIVAGLRAEETPE